MTRCKLGDHISIKHGYAFDGEFFSDQDNGIVLVTPGNFAMGGGYQEGKGKYYTGEYPAEFVLQPDDLIVTMTDLSKRIDTLGYGALVPSDGRVYLHNQRIGLVQLNDGQVDKYYLSFLMRSYDYQRSIAGSSTGSTVHHSSPKKICEYEFDLPPLETQRRIASILMAYDNLIENNRKQIALLEEVAQRLYKEWFIDLRFPGHEDVEIVDGVPQGWQEATVGDLCALSKVVSKERDRTPNIKYIGLEHMPRKSICLDTYGDVCSVKGNKLVFEAGDILFGKIRPYFHKVGFAQCDGVASADTIIMRPMRRRFGLLLGCVSSDDFVSYATKTSKTGTKMPRADWAAMEQYPVLIPEDGLLDLFEEKFTALASGIATLSGSSHAAREARDRLLPKLMSGEIEV